MGFFGLKCGDVYVTYADRATTYTHHKPPLLNVAIPRDFSGTEHADFSLDSGMFFINIFFVILPILTR